MATRHKIEIRAAEMVGCAVVKKGYLERLLNEHTSLRETNESLLSRLVAEERKNEDLKKDLDELQYERDQLNQIEGALMKYNEELSALIRYSLVGDNADEIERINADLHPQLEQERDDLRRQLERARQKTGTYRTRALVLIRRIIQMRKLSLVSAEIENGNINIALEGSPIHAIAAWMADWFVKVGGTNYVEIQMSSPALEELGPFVFTVQRLEGKTPHMLREEAEAKLEQALAEIDRLRDGLKHIASGDYSEYKPQHTARYLLEGVRIVDLETLKGGE